MGYETINVTPVTPRIGAEVDGLTLAKPLSNRQVEELHQALAEHQVLFFRDQALDVEGHKAFGRYFGDLHIHPNTPAGRLRPAGRPCAICTQSEHARHGDRAWLNWLSLRIFKHQVYDLMFDGDCRRKFDFLSEPVRPVKG